MKFSASVEALHAAVKTAMHAVEKKNTIPILGHFHIHAGDGVVTLRGTDLDTEIKVRTAAEVADYGTVCLPARTLQDILGKLAKDANVIVEEAKGKVTVRCGRSPIQALKAGDENLVRGCVDTLVSGKSRV